MATPDTDTSLAAVFAGQSPHVDRLWHTLRVVPILLLGSALIALWNPSWSMHSRHYLPLHSFVELIAVTIAAMIFAGSWFSQGRAPLLASAVIGCSMLSAALLDVGHLLSYEGMPDFVTPSSGNKTIYFWLAARYASVAGLLCFTLLPWRKPIGRGLRLGLLLAILLVTATVFWIILSKPELLPPVFRPDIGLTTTKIAAEVVLIALLLLGALLLLKHRKRTHSYSLDLLLAATLIMALSEAFFTAYTSLTDAYNLAGHLLKITAYLYLFSALIHSGISEPYRQLQQMKDRLQVVLDSMPVGVAINTVDDRVHFSYMNDQFPKVYGTTRETLESTDFWTAVYEDPEFREAIRNRVIEGSQSGDPRNMVWRDVPISRQGQPIRYITAHNVLLPPDGELSLSLAVDVTQERSVAEQLRIAAVAFETSRGVIITDAQQIIQRANSALIALTGFEEYALVGQPASLLLGSQAVDLLDSVNTEGSSANKAWRGELWLHQRDGEAIPCEVSIAAAQDDEGKVSHYLCFFNDLSKIRQAEDQIERLAHYDPLTGLANRQLLLDTLSDRIAQHSEHTALMLIDLDEFKLINDSLGHDAGDELLTEIARRLRSLARGSDLLARLTGDEFALVFDVTAGERSRVLERASLMADRVRRAINLPSRIHGRRLMTTCALGIAITGSRELGVLELLRQADMAMNRAKKSGRNGLQFFDPALQQRVQEQLNLEADLRTALSQAQFTLYFQIQVESSGKPYGAEALIRWSHPQRGLLTPGDFLPTAEQIGMMPAIGSWVLETAVMRLHAWQMHPATQSLSMSVNINAEQLYNGALVDDLRALIQRYPIAAEKLVLELTEGTLLRDINAAQQTMSELRQLGASLSIDDFGTGYSSLAYLSQLPLHELKIDRSFVQEVESNPSRGAIVEAIINLAKALDLSVVAEGVETRSELNFLRKHACHRYQGYLFGKPMPATEFLERVSLLNAPPN